MYRCYICFIISSRITKNTEFKRELHSPLENSAAGFPGRLGRRRRQGADGESILQGWRTGEFGNGTGKIHGFWETYAFWLAYFACFRRDMDDIWGSTMIKPTEDRDFMGYLGG